MIKFPTNNADRLDVLDTLLLFSAQAGSTLPNESDNGPVEEQATSVPTVPIPEDLNQRIQQCRSTLHRMRQEEHATKLFLQKQRKKRDAELSKVRDGLRSYWKSLNLYMEINPEAEEPYSFYGLHNGQVSSFSAAEASRTGRDVLQATETAGDAGYPVITLGNSHHVFKNAVTELGKLVNTLAREAETKTERKLANQEARAACQELFRDVAAELRHAYRKYDPVDVREKLRAYGFEFYGANQNTPTQAADEGQTQTTDANQAATDENQAALKQV